MLNLGRCLILLAFLSLAGCASVRSYSDYQAFGTAADKSEVIPVSLQTLAANPTAYNGKRVRTAGVLQFEQEDDALFFDQGSYRNRVHLNSVGIQLDEALLRLLGRKRLALSGRYAEMEGTFEGVLPEAPCAGYPKISGDEKLPQISENVKLVCLQLGLPSAGGLKDIAFMEVYGE